MKKKSGLNENKPAPIQKLQVESQTPGTNIEATTVVTSSVYTSSIPKPTIAVKTKEETPTDSKPVFKRPGSISISAPSATPTLSTEDTSNSVVAQPTVIFNKPFTADELIKAWYQFSETISEQGRMASLFMSTLPQVISPTTFEVTVSNVLQEKELKRLQSDILAYIQTFLQNSSIKMNVKIAEESAAQRGNSPEDRYKLMVEQNPALDILKNGLQLEID